jgi:membrane-bound lytic murein transglycosylase MltF
MSIDTLPHGSTPASSDARRSTLIRIGGALCLALLSFLGCGCSKGKNAEVATESKSAAEQTASSSTQSEPDMEDTLPPALRTPWKGDLDEMIKRRVVRVLLPFRRPEFFYMDGHPAGILQETFRELERVLNSKYKTTAGNHIIVALLPTPTDKLEARFSGGYGDVAAYGISITDANKQIADFTVPTLTGNKMIVVTGPGAPELGTVEDLSGKEIWVTPQTRMKGDVEALNARLKAQGRVPAVIREADPLLEPADVMEMVNAGTYPIALMQSKTAEFWAPVFVDAKARMDLALAEDVEFGWAIQKGTPKWKAFLDEFIQSHGVGTSFGNTIMRRYLKETKYIKNARDAAEMKKFRATAPMFTKYGEKYGVDALLLLAQGYQESGLDQAVKSRVGAVGIMQVMPSTAAAAPVNIPAINTEDANIHAGVRMIHFLVEDYFKEEGLDQFNRTLFAIAAYNAGPAKITKCRQVAKDMGYDPNKWFGNVEVATAKLVGRETTQYVANIYKYYVAYRMAWQIRERRSGTKGK